MTNSPNLRTAFCRQAHLPESAFDEAVFWRGLYRHAVPFAFLIRLVAPGFFRDDFDFIHFLGVDASMDEVNEDIDRFEYRNRVHQHWMRTGLRLHVSPARVSLLASKFLPA